MYTGTLETIKPSINSIPRNNSSSISSSTTSIIATHHTCTLDNSKIVLEPRSKTSTSKPRTLPPTLDLTTSKTLVIGRAVCMFAQPIVAETSCVNQPTVLDTVNPVTPTLPSYSFQHTGVKNYVAPNECVERFFSRYLLRWVSIEPSVPTIAFHLSTFLHHRLECTIIEPSNILAKISKLIVPSACVINSTVSQFHELIRQQIVFVTRHNSYKTSNLPRY